MRPAFHGFDETKLEVRRVRAKSPIELFPTIFTEVRRSSLRQGKVGRERSARPCHFRNKRFQKAWRMSEDLKPSLMTPREITAVLVRFGKLLDGFALQLPTDKNLLAKLVRDAAAAIKELAHDVGSGDPDIAVEIVKSAARLVAAIREQVTKSPLGVTIH